MGVEKIEVAADRETIAAWQSHFQEGVTDDKDAMTCTELADLAGIAVRAMQARLRKGVREGMYTVTRTKRTDSIGRPQYVPAYCLAKKKQSKRGR